MKKLILYSGLTMMQQIMLVIVGQPRGKKIIAKFLNRIATIKNNKQKQKYSGEHDQEHHDDWTWNDH